VSRVFYGKESFVKTMEELSFKEKTLIRLIIKANLKKKQRFADIAGFKKASYFFKGQK